MAEFDRRVPTSTELAEITEKGYGVGLRRIPRKHRDLRFLEDAPELQASWISGPVVPDRIPTMTGLTQLSLLSTGVDELNLSRLTELRYYEGPLRGHESVLSLPRVTELCFDPATGGRLDGIPRTVRSLILTRATGVDSLAPIAGAPHLLELSIDGPRALDISAVAELPSLRVLRLAGITSLTGAAALVRAPGLRELAISSVANIDDADVLSALDGVDVIVDGV